MATWLAALAFAGIAALLPGIVSAQAIPVGSAQRSVVAGGEPIEVFTYKPASYAGGPLLVVLHGLERNAAGYRNHAMAIADAHGYVVAAPLFDAARFPQWRYQWAGVARRARQPDASIAVQTQPEAQHLDSVLGPLIEVLRRADGAVLPVALLGHSGGAQALLRWVAFARTDAMHIVVANPGTWLMPTREFAFPYGFGQLPDRLADERRVSDYLGLRVTVLLGQRDLSTRNLVTEPEAALQGDTRLARGRNAFESSRQAALARGGESGWRLVEVPDTGHSARLMFASPEALQALALPR